MGYNGATTFSGHVIGQPFPAANGLSRRRLIDGHIKCQISYPRYTRVSRALSHVHCPRLKIGQVRMKRTVPSEFWERKLYNQQRAASGAVIGAQKESRLQGAEFVQPGIA